MSEYPTHWEQSAGQVRYPLVDGDIVCGGRERPVVVEEFTHHPYWGQRPAEQFVERWHNSERDSDSTPGSDQHLVVRYRAMRVDSFNTESEAPNDLVDRLLYEVHHRTAVVPRGLYGDLDCLESFELGGLLCKLQEVCGRYESGFPDGELREFVDELEGTCSAAMARRGLKIVYPSEERCGCWTVFRHEKDQLDRCMALYRFAAGRFDALRRHFSVRELVGLLDLKEDVRERRVSRALNRGKRPGESDGY